MRLFAFTFVMVTACGGQEPAAPSTPSESAKPVECPEKVPDGGTCPEGCTTVEDRCLTQKGIIAPH
ncbi:MAG: hypothetical protein KIT84_24990 [Labilithrix sp.]|nr:hypothetical protein [Labilithrix sp.]MCW5814307.1 hypothetical protein [Labilithrix sp.]